MALQDDLLKNAQDHFALLICFGCLTTIIFIARTILLWNKPLRMTDKFCNAFFTYSCASNIGNITGLAYKCSKEIEVRKWIRDMNGGADRWTKEELDAELDKLLLSPYWLKMVFFIGFFYMVELWVLKGAFISMYWGLFSRVQTHLKKLLYVTTAVVAATFIALVPMYLCWCMPVERNWTSDLLDYQKCAYNPSKVAHTYQASFNIVTDLMIISLPLTIITSLHLNRPEKLALLLVFAIGFFSITSSILRFSAVIRALSGDNYTLMSLRELERWSVVEFSMALLAFCLPALRGLVVKVFGSSVVSGGSGSGAKHPGGVTGLASKAIGAKKDNQWAGYSNVGETQWDGASEEAVSAKPRRRMSLEASEERWEMTGRDELERGTSRERLNSLESVRVG